MLDESVEQALEERLAKRMQEANSYVLKQIAKTLSKIGTITPSQATRLVNVLKFGGNYKKIVKELQKYTKLNEKDIDKIFNNVAKQNEMFAKQFYDYRNIPMIPFDKNNELKDQVRAIAQATKGEMGNISDTWGFQKIVNGERINTPLSQVYQDVIDRGVYAVSQGKESFNQEARRIIGELTRSGLRKIDFDSGYSRRVDSQVRMNLKDGMRTLNNTMFQQFGEEFGADGVEISVHELPAPDHQEVQGRQFSTKKPSDDEMSEFEKFQNDKDCYAYDPNAKDHKGKFFPSVSVETGHDRRSIGQYNCYHDIFPIILGLTKPRYTDEELQKFIDDANKKIKFEGKTYTMYEATQLQRKLETEVRKEKDRYNMARELGKDGEDEMLEAEKNIRLLEKKYFNLSKVSGLETDVERLWVQGYKYNKLTEEQENRLKDLEKPIKIGIEKPKDDEPITSIPQNVEFDEEEYFAMQVGDLSDRNIDIDSYVANMDRRVREANLDKLTELADKYSHDAYFNDPLKITYKRLGEKTYGKSWYNPHEIALNNLWYANYDKLYNGYLEDEKIKWHPKTLKDENRVVATLVHEYGHTIEWNYLKMLRESARRNNSSFSFKKADTDLRDTIMRKTLKKTGEKLSITEFKKKYFTGYGKYKQNYEWFAEGFCQMELGEQNEFTEAIKEWLGEFYE